LGHTTVLRRSSITLRFKKRWKRFAPTAGGSGRMDEVYMMVPRRLVATVPGRHR
jgi:hypothetical protein